MKQKLTDTIVKALPAPAGGNRITYDDDVAGFGVRVTKAGAKSYVLNYRTRSGRERRITIGSYPDWKTGAAREEAKELKKAVDRGDDPMSGVEADRDAKTVADLVDRFRTDHLARVRPSTRRNYEILIDKNILPNLKHHRVAEVSFSDVDAMHRKVTRAGQPYQANRSVAVLSKMFSLAIRWQWRADNPAKGIERNPEEKRHRYLSADELSRLSGALSVLKDQQGANVIRLLLLTGARSGEVMAMRWADLDLGNGVWTKPASTTKQKNLHRVPLSGPARQLLSEISGAAEKSAKQTGDPVSEFVFPGRGSDHRIEVKSTWRAACDAAEIESARIHDLRHTYASVLASAGMSLPIIGALLGHSQPATTARYAHLLDDPLRQATERAGALVMPSGQSAELVSIKGAAK